MALWPRPCFVPISQGKLPLMQLSPSLVQPSSQPFQAQQGLEFSQGYSNHSSEVVGFSIFNLIEHVITRCNGTRKITSCAYKVVSGLKECDGVERWCVYWRLVNTCSLTVHQRDSYKGAKLHNKLKVSRRHF